MAREKVHVSVGASADRPRATEDGQYPMSWCQEKIASCLPGRLLRSWS